MNNIEVKNLTKAFGSQKAVNDVSFAIPPRSIVGFLGPNGAGKSTCLGMIAGIVKPTDGEVLIRGEMMSPEHTNVKRNIGFLPESNPLYVDMYVKEFLSFWGKALKLKNLSERIETIIDQVGLASHANKLIKTLSKGYKQRVGIAQALLHDPEILILDEPISGLDPNQLLDIRLLIRELGKEKTIIYSTHILQEVEATCDRVLILNEGNLIADHSSSELFQLRSGQQQLRLLFDGEFSQTNLFDRLPEVTIRTGATKGEYILSNMLNKGDLRKNIIDLIKTEDWPILEMNEIKSDFNHLFQSLTKDQKAS